MKYKHRLSCGLIGFAVFLTACGEGLNRASYQPVLPPMPSHWREVLGEPHWRLQWLEDGGVWQTLALKPDNEPQGIPIIPEWTTPVLAWPYWPERGLLPGAMRPAGALFPWDASGGRVNLSWKGGIDAFFWQELAIAERNTQAVGGRIPWYFAWPRFRELFESENISEAVRYDPWLADWREISRRTVQSGFDRRRITTRQVTEIAIPDLDGFWIGSSPFAAPLEVAPGGPLVVNAADTPDTWVSSEGILKGSKSGWVLIRE